MAIAEPDLEASGTGAKRPGALCGAAELRPATLLWLGAAVVLVFLVVAPMLRLLVSSFQLTDSGAFTLANYVTAYGNARG